MTKVIIFNEHWQANEDTEVMVSNRKGKGDCQIFCRADEVEIGDNVWEHNIVNSIRVASSKKTEFKTHYGVSRQRK